MILINPDLDVSLSEKSVPHLLGIGEGIRSECPGVGWESDQIDGWIMHAVRFDESGEIHMVNVWESLDDMSEAFVSRLGSVMLKLGIPQPQVEVFDAYNVNVFTTTF